MSDEDFSRVIDVNLKGRLPHHARPRALPSCASAAARIVNMASVVGLMGKRRPGQLRPRPKAGLIGLTKSVARELAPRAA